MLALLLYTMLPPVLGYAGLAYTDMALVAAMLCFPWRWAAFLRGPGLRRPEVPRVMRLVSAHAHRPRQPAPPPVAPFPVQHQQCRVALGGSVGLRGHRIHDEAMAVLHQYVAQVTAAEDLLEIIMRPYEHASGPVGLPDLTWRDLPHHALAGEHSAPSPRPRCVHNGGTGLLEERMDFSSGKPQPG